MTAQEKTQAGVPASEPTSQQHESDGQSLSQPREPTSQSVNQPASQSSSPPHEQRAATLVQALPYIQKFAGKTMVIKCGGAVMQDEAMRQSFADDVFLLHSVGIRPVLVHGGGPQITESLDRFGIQTQAIGGHRITDADTLEVVRMVLMGKINKDIVGALNRFGEHAVGLSGEDACLLKVTQRDEQLGFVGDVVGVNTDVLARLTDDGFIPVIASIGVGDDGQAYNINADMVAGELAAALQAEKLILLTDVDGLLTDVGDPQSRIPKATVGELEEFVASGRAQGGMLPKLDAAKIAVEGGTTSAHLINGTQKHALVIEIFTDDGAGTMITAGGKAEGGDAGGGKAEGGVSAGEQAQ